MKLIGFKSILSLLIISLVLGIGYLVYKVLPIGKQNLLPIPKAEFNAFGKAKFHFLPLMKIDPEPNLVASPSAEESLQPRSLKFGEAKLTFWPLSNTFEGSVPNAKTIGQYRAYKQAIVEHLSDQKNIKVCDLNIYWSRPQAVEKDQLTPQDIITDGCDL